MTALSTQVSSKKRAYTVARKELAQAKDRAELVGDS